MEVFIVLFQDFDDVSVMGVYSKKELAEKRIEELKKQRLEEYKHWWSTDRVHYRRKLYNTIVPNQISKEQDDILLEESLAKLSTGINKNYSIEWMVMDG